MMSYFPRSSFTVTCLIAIIVCANVLSQVENKYVFGIGTRIAGDGLLLKDIRHTPPLSLTEEPVVKFNYILVEPITYIKIESNKVSERLRENYFVFVFFTKNYMIQSAYCGNDSLVKL